LKAPSKGKRVPGLTNSSANNSSSANNNASSHSHSSRHRKHHLLWRRCRGSSNSWWGCGVRNGCTLP
jgi:hypothetical protein